MSANPEVCPCRHAVGSSVEVTKGGRCARCGLYVAWLVSPTTPLTRLDRAKAALEEAKAEYARLERIKHDAGRACTILRAELAAAEQEAAQPQPVPPPLPDALVEVARGIEIRSGRYWYRDDVLGFIAKSHGVSVEALRTAMKEAQRGGA